MNLSTLLASSYLWPDVAFVSGAIACVALVGLYWKLKRTFREGRATSASSVEELSTGLEAANHELEKLSRRIYEVEQRYTPAAEYTSEAASVNLTRRGQVIQLHRRGKEPPAIASALKVSQGEVKLIIKIHDLTQPGLSGQTSQGFPLKSRRSVR